MNKSMKILFSYFFRTCVDYGYDFVDDVILSTYNDPYQKMNTYLDTHEMVAVMLKEEMQVVEVVALNTDHHRTFDNKLDHCR
jgi:hypothetical protein